MWVEDQLNELAEVLGVGAAALVPSHPRAVVGEGSAAVEFEDGGTIRYFFADRRYEAECRNCNRLTPAGRPCRLSRNVPEDFSGVEDTTRFMVLGRMSRYILDSFNPEVACGGDHKNPF